MSVFLPFLHQLLTLSEDDILGPERSHSTVRCSMDLPSLMVDMETGLMGLAECQNVYPGWWGSRVGWKAPFWQVTAQPGPPARLHPEEEIWLARLNPWNPTFY